MNKIIVLIIYINKAGKSAVRTTKKNVSHCFKQMTCTFHVGRTMKTVSYQSSICVFYEALMYIFYAY